MAKVKIDLAERSTPETKKSKSAKVSVSLDGKADKKQAKVSKKQSVKGKKQSILSRFKTSTSKRKSSKKKGNQAKSKKKSTTKNKKDKKIKSLIHFKKSPGKQPFYRSKAFLSAVMIILILLLIYPIAPEIIYHLKNLNKETEVQVDQPEEDTVLGEEDKDPNLRIDGKPIDPKEKRLIIPKIDLNTKVVEGQTEKVLNKGAWHRPGTSSPPKGGNTVITGHRFMYLPPNNMTFYHLDKLDLDDKIYLYWKGKEYIYAVSETRVVPPTALSVEKNTKNEQLTLYTCEPLWTADQRLVVTALPDISEPELDEESEPEEEIKHIG